MRHGKKHRKLNRTSSHRKALFKNMATSLLKHEIIRTTLPKAKELRKFAEPLITLGRDSSVHNQRLAFSRLRDREIVVKLFGEIGPRYSKRNGGYTRILKCGYLLSLPYVLLGTAQANLMSTYVFVAKVGQFYLKVTVAHLFLFA